MSYHSLAGAALAIALALPAAAQDTPTADTVIATVNGTEITLGHMLTARAALPQEYQQLPPDVLFTGVLDQLIQQSVLSDSLEEEPNRLALSLENERRSMRAGEVVNEVATGAVTEEAVTEAYEARVAAAESAPEPEFNASHILVETEEEAAAIVEELNGGADFAELAAEKSTGPSGPNGGSLGWFGAGMMVPEFEAAVMEMEPEKISAPVQTQFGWHVIRLNETRTKDAPSLDELRPELEGQLQQQAVQQRIEELESAAEITRPEDGAFDPAIINDLTLLNP